MTFNDVCRVASALAELFFMVVGIATCVVYVRVKIAAMLERAR